MTPDTDGVEMQWLMERRGIETLACARYQAFEDVVDVVAAERQVDRITLRECLAHWVDHGLDTADDNYDVPREIIIEAGERCKRAAQKQYEDHFWHDHN